MSQDEVFDVLNEQMIKVGEATRQKVHGQGLWHQTFHCWIVHTSITGETSLLLQLRHKDKDTYPNLLDISCAGHLKKGESVEDGLRELKEELGMTVSFDDLIYCGMIAEEEVISNTCIDREFNQVFIYACNQPLVEYNFQKSEVSGLFLVNLVKYKQLLNGELESLVAEGIIFDESNERLHNDIRKIHKADLTPMSNEYIDLLFGELQKQSLYRTE